MAELGRVFPSPIQQKRGGFFFPTSDLKSGEEPSFQALVQL